MKALGTLAGGVAHDFNNLLMGIQGRASIMRMQVDAASPILEHLRGIEESVQSAAALTKQLLGFARGGKYELIKIDLNEFVENQSRLFGRTRKDITIHESFDPELWPVEADRGQIEQVLLNVLVNAWQAMPGGGDLFILSENCLVNEKQAQAHDVRPGKFARVSIRDTGIGMDTEVVARIFDPFFTTKEIGRGTGLGLASAYGILHNHGGFIEVATEKAKGSTFSICLPATKSAATLEKPTDKSIIRGDETLLLIDDEKTVLDVGREVLEILGYRVLAVTSGKEALSIYPENADQIDMVILDMIMPGMDGREIYEKLKAINPEVRVLLSSGYSINGEATKILEMGCDGFIQKPYNMGDLSAKIREILNGT
ncbi:MAG: response regulator [Desulfobacterales bacterium]|nr:response regulator [Desulfobacterales bacterium]